MNIKKFKLENITKLDKCNVLIIGADDQNTGYICRDILQQLVIEGHKGKLVSPAIWLDETLYNNVGKENVYGKYNDQIIESLENDFLIMHDCIKCSKFTTNSILSKILCDHHSKITPLILTVNNPLAIHPKVKDIFDYIFILNDDVYSSRQKLYEQYCDMITFDEFKKTIDNHTCIVINNRSKSEAFYYDIVHKF
jgi:hypothetical protein